MCVVMTGSTAGRTDRHVIFGHLRMLATKSYFADVTVKHDTVVGL